MNLKLTFLCDAPDAVTLVQRYWAVDEHGHFSEQVRALLPFRNLTGPRQVTRYVREQCRVFDLNQPCPRCGEPLEITCRSEARLFPPQSRRPCDICARQIERAMQVARKKAECELAERLHAYMHAHDAAPLNYNNVADDTALLLLALANAMPGYLPEGPFGHSDCSAWVPAEAGCFIRRLFQAGVLVEEPVCAQRGAYFLKGGQLRVEEAQRVFALSPGATAARFGTVLASYRARSFNDAPRLHDLWLDYAAADCMAYLREQAALHSLPLLSEELADVHSVLRCGLEHYSVAQLWSVIWRVVCEAASLAGRPYYNATKSAATIPGKLRRLLGRGRREGLKFHAAQRPAGQPAGTLGMLFSECFGLDENTAGSLVWGTLARRSDQWAALGEHNTWALARRLMVRALETDLPFITLKQLGERLQGGEGLEEAINQVLEQLPAPAPGGRVNPLRVQQPHASAARLA